jgi:dipeptidyl aminopeptidase/acylaminoacyl peptidase
MVNLLDALLSLPRVYNFMVSPDRRHVAFTWANVHENLDVFIAPTDTSSPPAFLTRTPEATILYDWASDSRSLIVGEDKGRDERIRLFRVTIEEPGVMSPLTEGDPPFFLRGGSLHPNNRWLIYGANYDFSLKSVKEATWVYRHDLLTGEIVTLASPTKPNYVVPSLSPNGTRVLYNRKDLNPSGEQLWLVNIDGTDDREAINFGAMAKVVGVWAADDRHVVFTTDMRGGKRLSQKHVGQYDVETGAIEWLVEDSQRSVEYVHCPRQRNAAVVVEVRGARQRSSVIDLDTLEEHRLPELKGTLLPGYPVNGNEWIGLYSSSTQPDELVRFDLTSSNPASFKPITEVWNRSGLEPKDLTPAEEFGWTSVDGLEISGWLYRTKWRVKRAVIHVHGGPTAHSADAVNPLIQFLVANGFNVLDPNYRGSTGYGIAFRELIKEDGWGGREQDDIACGAKALIQRDLAAAGRVGITGTSYGGYSSWVAITRYPRDLIAAAAPICGMTDLIVDYKTTRPDLRPYSEEMIGGSPDQIPEKYHERSPINFVENIKGGLLIIQGARDPNVTPANVEEVEKRLKDAKVHYEKLVFEDEGHGIIKLKNRRTLYLALLEFFGVTLGS